jgi:hypothetical protein
LVNELDTNAHLYSDLITHKDYFESADVARTFVEEDKYNEMYKVLNNGVIPVDSLVYANEFHAFK